MTTPSGLRTHGLRTDQVPAVRRAVAPRYAQGGSVHPRTGAAYLTESLSTCGVLRTAGGRRLAFAPGAEGIAFDDRGGLWAVLESGSRGYQLQDRPLTPMLARFDLGQLRDGADATCPW